MKKVILLIPFLLMACKKEAPENINPENRDSILAVDQTSAPLPKDSLAIQDSLIANSAVVEKVLDEGVNRSLDKDEIVRTADGSMLPFSIGDQFTSDNQKFVLKITNVKKPKLKISLDTKTPMNIRINQIKKPDGTFDGPFGRTLNLVTKQAGEYWIIIGKNQMADGSRVGHFTIKVD